MENFGCLGGIGDFESFEGFGDVQGFCCVFSKKVSGREVSRRVEKTGWVASWKPEHQVRIGR